MKAKMICEKGLVSIGEASVEKTQLGMIRVVGGRGARGSVASFSHSSPRTVPPSPLSSSRVHTYPTIVHAHAYTYARIATTTQRPNG